MDADRFDTLAKRLVTPTTRRATLGAAAAGGLLSALGLRHAAPQAHATQGGPCVLAFVAMVRQGPSVDQALTTNGSRPGELRGELSFSLSATGNLEDGTLLLPNGASLPVVGQAMGHALQVRIELAPRLALVALGVGEQEVAACQGAIDGVATGPDVGDLGDWHAAALRRADGAGGIGSGGTGAARQGAPRRAAAPSTTGRTGGSGATAALSNAGPTAPAGPTPTPPAGPTGSAAAASTNTGPTGSPTTAPTPTPPGGGMLDLTAPTGPSGSTTGSTAPALSSTGSTSTGPTGPATESAQCAPGLSRCLDVCVDLSSDRNNCGACGHPCTAEQGCHGGACTGARPICPGGLESGEDSCNGVCVDLQSDPANCGACFNDCEGTPCIAGVCDQPTCTEGLTPCGDVCVDLQTDAANCGACGAPCGNNQFCEGGICMGGDQLCAPGLSLCGFGFCVDLQTDPANCGECGVPCGNDEICQGGLCTLLAAEASSETDILLDCGALDLADCGGVCVDLQSDRTNCGTCGNPCTEVEDCLSGICAGVVEEMPLVDCSALGLSSCGGACLDLQTDAGNCGACGNPCPAGFACCGGVCVDLLTDDNHCGYCGNPCERLTCRGGLCQFLKTPTGLPCVVDSDCTSGVCFSDVGVAICG